VKFIVIIIIITIIIITLELSFLYFNGMFLRNPYFDPAVSRGGTAQCSDWLRERRLRGGSSSPDRVENFLFSTAFRSVLGPTQPPIQWVSGALSPGVKPLGSEAAH
jgi:hypothetical protein